MTTIGRAVAAQDMAAAAAPGISSKPGGAALERGKEAAGHLLEGLGKRGEIQLKSGGASGLAASLSDLLAHSAPGALQKV